MTAIANGVKLVLALKASGTGEGKLEVGRRVLREKGQSATSADVVAAMEADPICSELTVKKAKSFAAHGEWVPEMFEVASKPIEEQLAEQMNVPPPPVPPPPVPGGESLTAEIPGKKKV
jgi:hypothetical protein